MSTRASILIFDEETTRLETFKEIASEHYDVFIAKNYGHAEAILRQQWIQVIVSKQPLLKVRELYPEILWLRLTTQNPTNPPINDIHHDTAHLFIDEPLQRNDVNNKVKKALEFAELQRENERLSIELKLKPDTIEKAMVEKRQALRARFDWDSGIIRSPESSMNDVCNLIHHVAPFDVNVLLTGESGTGKELCARALHYNSLRQDKVFIAENCAALPDELLESELFGHKRGAFTGAIEDRVGLFEQANGGTIFLDEIGETSPAFQTKLLRTIQEGVIRRVGESTPRSIDVRVITATNRDLKEDIKNNSFRRDLFYRLSTFEIHLPPLRERKNDILPLAISILNASMEKLGKHVKGITDEALQCLKEYHWPGNVREMQNEIKRMLVLGQDEYLSSNLISKHILRAAPEEASADIKLLTGMEGSLKERVESLELIIIKETLMRLRWNKTKVAEELGLSRVGLRNKMERYGLEKNAAVKTVSDVA
ncbi:MAG TPA: sigma-54-dependent Fis family transcriptional regulator [Cycloclasticus sp.]|nr:sigma-54-dependent Fis family transcriptional regulator [Cycloclasticus sp.]HIL91984.1 sigma-54-dependent Fis family transcriptional regulator [Cycloclasticus sp.]